MICFKKLKILMLKMLKSNLFVIVIVCNEDPNCHVFEGGIVEFVEETKLRGLEESTRRRLFIQLRRISCADSTANYRCGNFV